MPYGYKSSALAQGNPACAIIGEAEGNNCFLASLSEGGAPKGRKESPRWSKANLAGPSFVGAGL